MAGTSANKRGATDDLHPISHVRHLTDVPNKRMIVRIMRTPAASGRGVDQNQPSRGASTIRVPSRCFPRPIRAGQKSGGDPATQTPCDALIRATVANPKRAGPKIFFIAVGTRIYDDFGGWRNSFFSTNSCNIAGIRGRYTSKKSKGKMKASGTVLNRKFRVRRDQVGGQRGEV